MASKFPSDTSYLNPRLTNPSEIWYTFGLAQTHEPMKKFAKPVHQGLGYGTQDGTLEGEKDQPQLNIRTLVGTNASFGSVRFVLGLRHLTPPTLGLN